MSSFSHQKREYRILHQPQFSEIQLLSATSTACDSLSTFALFIPIKYMFMNCSLKKNNLFPPLYGNGDKLWQNLWNDIRVGTFPPQKNWPSHPFSNSSPRPRGISPKQSPVVFLTSEDQHDNGEKEPMNNEMYLLFKNWVIFQSCRNVIVSWRVIIGFFFRHL